jgi:hypothetical protein
VAVLAVRAVDVPVIVSVVLVVVRVAMRMAVIVMGAPARPILGRHPVGDLVPGCRSEARVSRRRRRVPGLVSVVLVVVRVAMRMAVIVMGVIVAVSMMTVVLAMPRSRPR